MQRRLTVLVAATVALIVATVAGAVGELAQKPGTAGCISDDGTGGECQDGTALRNTFGVAVSPDGKNVYTAAELSEAVGIFDRDPATGALTQKAGVFGCISETGTGGCQDGKALFRPISVAVSPDGKSVYTAAYFSNAVAIFDRDPVAGALTQKALTAGCVSDNGSASACQDGNALGSAWNVIVSPDGSNVYAVAQGSSSVVIFDRDATGALTQKAGSAGCVAETAAAGCQDGTALSAPYAVTISADGRTVYTASTGSNAVAVLERDPATGALAQKAGTLGCVSETGTGGACQDGKALDVPTDVVVSPDGKSVYVVSVTSDAIAIFDRDPATGAVTQKPGTAGCISDTGSGGSCLDGTALADAQSVAVAPDGGSVYVGSTTASNAVAIFDRDPATGALSQKPGTAGCVSDTGSSGVCQDGRALLFPADLAASPDGKNLYVAGAISAAVAILDRATPPSPPSPPPPPPPSPPAPPPPPARDRVAPIVSGFSVSPSPFRVANQAAPRGSRVRFTLSERANAGVVIERALPGRRVGRRCVAPTRKLRKRGRCTRFKRIGTLTYRNRPRGANRIPFSGRVGRRALPLGSYRATITATDPAGNRSNARRAAFRIVRR